MVYGELMTIHDIRIKDLRPIGSKNTLMCIHCGCMGKRDLKKYSTCDQYFNKPFRGDI